MVSLLAVVGIGFILGMRHAADPDHVVAVTTIVSREGSLGQAALIGALWGIGHTVTVVATGCAILLFGLVIPARAGLAMEFAVGVMLVLLGALNLSGASQEITERLSPRAAADGTNGHGHVHFWGDGGAAAMLERAEQFSGLEASRLGRAIARLGIYQTLRPLLVGVVHGLAGSAAVALLVLGTIQEPRWGVLYLVVFGVGTIAGMMLITAAMAMPVAAAGERFRGLQRGMAIASGAVSVCFGLFLAFQAGFVNGFFTSHPAWAPR